MRIQAQFIANTRWTCGSCQRKLRLFSTCTRLSKERTDHSKARNNRAFDLERPARTRFAPSPTGKLHLGSLRTALYNYLVAKRTGGQFLLRIEDTDQKRTIEGAEAQLMLELQRYNLEWDEGPDSSHYDHFRGPFGPYRQSLRTEIYHEHANQIVRSQHAYRCFCSPERLNQLARRRNDLGLPLGYDRKCLQLSAIESEEKAASEPFVVRLKAAWPNTDHSSKPNVQIQGQEVFYDPILIKSDGHATYHFANVVDDHLMKITHVIRGTEWITALPVHLTLYNAFGWKPPLFCHVPLIIDESGQKLSKRDKNCDLSTYQGPNGVYEDVLLNFVALLGWSHNEGSDVFTLEKMKKVFTPKFTRGNAMLNLGKLQYLQKMHTKRILEEAPAGSAEFQSLVNDVQGEVNHQIPNPELSEFALRQMIESLLHTDDRGFLKSSFSSKSEAATEFVKRNAFFFAAPKNLSAYALLRANLSISNIHTAALALCLTPASAWNASSLTNAVESLSPPTTDTEPTAPSSQTGSEKSAKNFRMELFRWLRWALMARSPGPPIFNTLELLGRERSYQRVQDAIRLSKSTQQEEELARTRPDIKVQIAPSQVG